MKNNVDYIYEYSDLNFLKTRVQILTGIYKGIILELGGSGIAQWNENSKDKTLFNFEYTLYHKPKSLENKSLLKNQKFINFVSELALSIIKDRSNDKNMLEKLMDAAKYGGVSHSNIKINPVWYPIDKQPKPNAEVI
jgi:hypothetical protein